MEEHVHAAEGVGGAVHFLTEEREVAFVRLPSDLDEQRAGTTGEIADGDEREIAERELCEAEMKSNGLLSVDRHPRSGMPELLRLRVGGEEWLYQQIGEASPTAQRSELAKAFREMAERTVPEQWQQTWTEWFYQLSQAALDGGGVQPFRRDDSAGNEALVNALIGILNWQGPSLIRYASTAICADSKQLQKLEARLRPALVAITGSDVLEDFGILRKPRFVTFHGPLMIRDADRQIDFSMFAGPVALSETNFPVDCQITTTATVCLTVEKEDTFHELAATNPGILLILTSYAGSAVRHLLNLLPDAMRFLHFGDGDPAGSDILRDLRQKTGRDIQPLLIPGQTSHKRRPLAQTEHSTIKRLLDSDLPGSLLAYMGTLLDNGVPVDFEQEGVPIQRVWELVARDRQAAERRE